MKSFSNLFFSFFVIRQRAGQDSDEAGAGREEVQGEVEGSDRRKRRSNSGH
jgi:hypothetical protein